MVRLCTFNVRNLFLAGDPGTLSGAYGARPKRRAEIRALARALNRVDADLVGFQEVGSLAALGAVNELLTTPYPFLYLLPGNSRRGIHLAFASRRPLTVTSHAERTLRDDGGGVLEDYPDAESARSGSLAPLTLQRDLLRCDFGDGLKLCVFNVHLKSPNQPRWCRLSAEALRTAECRLIAEIVAENDRAGQGIVVLGDCNDVWPSSALSALQEVGLKRVATEGETLSADDVPSTADQTSATSYWPRAINIDHIMLNTVAADWLDAGSAIVHDAKSFRRGSDHCPVSVDLLLPDAQLPTG
jgi:endonuclease/exonuclease/phosphatase family metal-dependent hydrolase